MPDFTEAPASTALPDRPALRNAPLSEILSHVLRFLYPLNGRTRQRTFVACTLRLASERGVRGIPAGGTRGDEVRRLRIWARDSEEDRWSVPILSYAAVTCCKNIRVIIFFNLWLLCSRSKVAWPLPIVAHIFRKCPKLAVFILRAQVEAPDANSAGFWARALGQSMRQALGRLRALALPLSNTKAAAALPHLKILSGGLLDDPSLNAYAAECLQLVKVDLRSSSVTDAGVKELLSYCLTIEELDLTETKITCITIVALKEYRPPALLGLGYNILLFENGENAGNSDVELANLPRLRGSKLTRLSLGSPKYRVSADLVCVLLETCSRLRGLSIWGLASAFVLETIARRLTNLRSLEHTASERCE
ncbi:hypothetical protein BDK51DRAFT_44802 [Blyttiomyces helicus]|uniref:F-box domain-containing protein n=1 Tax=Blyttiomyces helicus TaxID=388810 RepID=A0A4P9WG28_9FUNG|nr:hypothetical protein BDK51DRAFT_44802 [Blyttiomyces helicus]|eukprot:RKO90298.1 hypothetical protein BDK51DRAFT_44802 [Blyttiomyces helicus]